MDEIEFLYGEKILSEYAKIHAQETPDKTVVNFYGKEMSWRQLDVMSNRLANAISDMGYKKGDRVAAFMQSCPQCYVFYLAALKLGLISVPIDPMHKELELEYALNDCGATLIMVLDQLYPIVNNVRDKCKIKDVIVTSYHDFMPDEPAFPLHPMMLPEKQTFPDTHNYHDLIEKYQPTTPDVKVGLSDDAWILYTGGTSGWPKGCLHTQRDSLIGGFGIFHLQLNANKEDILLIPVPHTHIYGISVGVAASFYGGYTVMVLTRWDAKAALEAIHKYKVTKIAWPMPCIASIINDPDLKKYDLNSLTTCNTIGFAIPFTRETAEKWYEITGCRLDNWGYAIGSENFNYCAYGCGIDDPFKDPGASGVGIPAPGSQIKITDFETREELPIGKTGNIVVKSPAGIRKYWNKPKETKENIADGWIYSGDIGRLGEDGLIYYYGRKRDVIKVSGYTLAPREVEVLGLQNPAIEKIAVIGLPHPKKGEIPKAFIELKPGSTTTEAELVQWFKDNIAAYKVPLVEIRRSLPISNKGEVLKRKLKEEELAKQETR
jgi:long-chain acyl-CoA synthetase